MQSLHFIVYIFFKLGLDNMFFIPFNILVKKSVHLLCNATFVLLFLYSLPLFPLFLHHELATNYKLAIR